MTQPEQQTGQSIASILGRLRRAPTKGLEAGTVDLAFADPPFNIGYKYDIYDDKPRG